MIEVPYGSLANLAALEAWLQDDDDDDDRDDLQVIAPLLAHDGS